MMITDKTPVEAAQMLVNLYNGDKEAAKIEVFNAVRSYNNKKGDKSNQYWNDVYKAIDTGN